MGAGVKSAVQANGLTLVAEAGYKVADIDFSSQVARMKAAGTDLIVIATVTRDTVGIMAEIKKLGHENVQPLAGGLTAFAGLSRTVRAADATERYLASPAAMPSGRWIGNPSLALEKHTQLDLGLAWEGERAAASAVAFVDRAGDYILRDRARGQDGVLLADGASVYRNVDASLHGLELEARWQWTQTLSLEAEAAWVRGQNRSDDRPLAQTMVWPQSSSFEPRETDPSP